MWLTIGIFWITPCLQRRHLEANHEKRELQNKVSHSIRVRLRILRSLLDIGRNRERCSDHEDRRWFGICTSSVLRTIKYWTDSFHIPSNLSRNTRLGIIAFLMFLLKARCLSEMKWSNERKSPIFPETLCYKINQQSFLKISDKTWNVPSMFRWSFFSRFSCYHFPFVSAFTRCCVNYSIILWSIVFCTFYVISTIYDFTTGHLGSRYRAGNAFIISRFVRVF